MMLKRTSSDTLLKRSFDAVRKAAIGVASLGIAASLTAGCLQRPVKKQDPRTNNVYVDQIRQTAVDKIDLLFMIDNSISMADKQAILADAVPVLVGRLITPNCVDAEGNSLGSTVGPDGLCGQGEAEFNAIRDIHIGIVSSSLGAHGGDVYGAGSEDERRQGSAHRRDPPGPDLLEQPGLLGLGSGSRTRTTRLARRTPPPSPPLSRRTCRPPASRVAVSRPLSKPGTASSSSPIRPRRSCMWTTTPSRRS